MTTLTFKGNPASTIGDLPEIGEQAPNFSLVASDLSERSLNDYTGKTIVLNIFPSLDTGVCALSVKALNTLAAELTGLQVLHISKDLPFAQKRFCQAENINNSETLSAYRSSFSDDYQLTLEDTPLKGLCARTVIVIDKEQKIRYVELVSEITQEPNYDQLKTAIEAL
ncbi:MAG: thiol peroxidase [bacterium]